MHFSFNCLVALPSLAWCAVLKNGDPECQVLHGEGVEVGKGVFFEGAWAGPFKERDICEAFCAGSGGVIRNGEVVFVTPSHTLEKLVIYQYDQGKYIVSNSIAFAFSVAEDDFDPRCPYNQNLAPRHPEWNPISY